MQVESEAGIWVRADATVFRLLLGVNRTARRMMAVERTKDAAHRRVGIVRRLRAARAEREHAAVVRKLNRELDEAWGCPIRIRQDHKPHGPDLGPQQKQRTSKVATARRRLKAYAAPLLDERGRVALYLNIKYVGLKSKGWRPGLSADHVFYIFRPDALEKYADGTSVLLGNMGESVPEIAAAWGAIEAVEQGYRANATVQYRLIWNLPHGLTPEERAELVNEFGERTFGRLGLPWAAAIHVPDAKGDERNFHAHIIFSPRPCERVGEFEWEIAPEKVNGLTDPAGLKVMRALAAAHMNRACRSAGKAERYTHQTYAERGIDADRQKHLGPARMAAHDRGEVVAEVENNARIVEANEAAAARDAVAKKLAFTHVLVKLISDGADLVARRRRLANLQKSVSFIADHARLMGVPRPKPPQQMASSVLALRTGIAEIMVRKKAVPPAIDDGKVSALATSLERIASSRRDTAAAPIALALTRRHLEAIRQRQSTPFNRESSAPISDQSARDRGWDIAVILGVIRQRRLLSEADIRARPDRRC